MEDEEAAAQQEPLLGVNAQAHPAWYTPKRLLALFSWLTFLIYLDQGLISSNGVNQQIQAAFQLSNVADGALPSAFLVGLLVASVVFSELTAHFNAFRMIGYGFGLWMLGSLACTFVPSFWVLVTCRVIMGAGEASIITLTGPFIDDVAPPAEKTLWFGVLNVFPTIGIAVGYICGGLIGPALGWRAAFLIQAVVSLPVVLWVLLARPIALQTTRAEEDTEGQSGLEAPGTGLAAGLEPVAPVKLGALQSLGADLATLGRHPLFMLNLLAYCPVQAAFGAFTFWGPKAGYELFDEPQEVIDLTFGVVTLITAIIATLLGGVFIDMVGSSIRNSMLFCGWTALVGFVVIEAGFILSRSFPVLMAIFAVGELALFAGQAPFSAVIVWTVPVRLRPLASGLSTVVPHLLGDVPILPIVGWVQGLLGDWRETLEVLSLILVITVVLYLAGSCVSGRDYRAPAGLGAAAKADEDGHLTQLEGAGGAAAVHSAQASQADVLR